MDIKIENKNNFVNQIKEFSKLEPRIIPTELEKAVKEPQKLTNIIPSESRGRNLNIVV